MRRRVNGTYFKGQSPHTILSCTIGATVGNELERSETIAKTDATFIAVGKDLNSLENPIAIVTINNAENHFVLDATSVRKRDCLPLLDIGVVVKLSAIDCPNHSNCIGLSTTVISAVASTRYARIYAALGSVLEFVRRSATIRARTLKERHWCNA